MDKGDASTSGARATVVVVARDRFSKARECLESVFANTAGPYELIYVDGGSPGSLRRWLDEQRERHGFDLVRTDRYLIPNEARNIGWRRAHTDYVVFLDNDVVVAPGWLDKLVECADATGAAVVGPLVCETDFDTIHFAGGEVGIVEETEDGAAQRRIRDSIRFGQRKVGDVASELRRERCTLSEVHCMLVRREALERIGGFDEEIMGTREHVDLCLAAERAGDEVWFEPESKVAFVGLKPLEPSDLHFYVLRWSDAWERRSLDRLREKWDLAEDEWFRRRYERLGWRRRTYVVGPIARRLTLGRGSRRVESALIPAERRLNALIARRDARRRERARVGAVDG